jgi:hypothetical protein
MANTIFVKCALWVAEVLGPRFNSSPTAVMPAPNNHRCLFKSQNKAGRGGAHLFPALRKLRQDSLGKNLSQERKKKKVHRKSKQRQRPVFISKEDVFS